MEKRKYRVQTNEYHFTHFIDTHDHVCIIIQQLENSKVFEQ